ncbi:MULTISPECIES: DUF3130 family protein [Listeria]|uniref:DUF3130 family protein n=1 Tax=Listeria TaxID=1637 RepID=UPI000B590548|nr:MULTISPECIES: DUF3130 family protein [Listeria]
MREIKSNEAVFSEHVGEMGKMKDKAYLPLREVKMEETYANSINTLRNSLIDLVLSVEKFGQVSGQDVRRLTELGAAFAKQDQALSRKGGPLGG